jgi:hypothetical protein
MDQLPSLITGASRNCGSTVGPIPTATRANLRVRRRHSIPSSGVAFGDRRPDDRGCRVVVHPWGFERTRRSPSTAALRP